MANQQFDSSGFKKFEEHMRNDDRRHAREQTQETTLEAAERIAGIDGIATLSLKRLAEEAGLSTMVVYSHFGDRYGLEEALVHRAFRSLQDIISADPNATIQTSAEAIREWANRHPARFSTVFLTAHTLDVSLRSLSGDLLSATAAVLERQLCWPATRAGDGLTLLSALFGFLAFELRGQLRENSAAAFTTLCRALDRLEPAGTTGI